MNLQNKHLCATMNKEIFHVNFKHYMELEGKCNNMEISQELGVAREEVHILKGRMSRA